MDFKTGVRVQKNILVDGKSGYRVGTISNVVSETVERKVRDLYTYKDKIVLNTEIKSVAVKWDDGEEELDVRRWDLYPEDSAIEREFRIKTQEVQALINAKLDLASKALSEAENLAEEHGISFSSSISPLGQSYRAESAQEKWPDLDLDFMADVTDTYGEYDGWQHSAVC